MKKIIKKIFVFLLILSILIPAFTTKTIALNSVASRDSLRRAVFVGNDNNDLVVAFGEGLSVEKGDDCDFADVSTASVIIVDYDVIIEKADIENDIKALKNFIYSGTFVYIRANGHSIVRDDVISMFGFDDYIGEVSKENKGDGTIEEICGFFVYIDSQNRPQITQSINVLVPSAQGINEDIVKTNSSETELLHKSNAFDYDLDKELDDIDNYLDFLSEKNENVSSEASRASQTGVLFEEAYATEHHYATVTKANGTQVNQHIGNVTVNLYAKRLECAQSNWYDKNQVTSKWVYASKIYIQPTWNESDSYRSLNKILGVYYVTHPLEASSSTYMMRLIAYAPEASISGSENVTLSYGLEGATNGSLTGSVGYSVTTTFKDVEIFIRYWERPNELGNDIAGTYFYIGTQSGQNNIKNVNKSVVALDSGVIMWNYYTVYSKMQIGYTACWRILQGNSLFSNNEFDVYKSNTYLWQPAELW